MDKNRLKVSVKQILGAIKEAVDKLVGDAKLTTQGQAEKATVKISTAVSGAKDALKP
jgi:uncharacterized protein YjbJ (UPF0337 family)